MTRRPDAFLAGYSISLTTLWRAPVRELGLRVILDLNLITATPKLAAAWASEAGDVMPPGSLIGYEIGNEPDLYSQSFWLATTQGDRFGGPVLPRAITPRTYAADYRAYARMLAPIIRGVALLAPALANPPTPWTTSVRSWRELTPACRC
jgi:hypothetical protein